MEHLPVASLSWQFQSRVGLQQGDILHSNLGLPQKKCSKGQELEAANVLGQAWFWKLPPVTSSIFSWSKQLQSPPPPPVPKLEQIAEGMFCGRSDKEFATVFDLLWSMKKKIQENRKMRKENILHMDSDRVVCKAAWAYIRHFCATLASFIYSVGQPAECVCSVGQSQCLTSRNK